MIKWFKVQSPTVKGMVVIILVLIVGIVLRWSDIKRELTESLNDRFDPSGRQTEQTDR